MKFVNLSGKRFGKLLVIKRVENNGHGHPVYLCVCDCGKKQAISASNLKSENSTQCLVCKYFKISEDRKLRPYEALYRTLQRTQSGRAVLLSYEDFLEFVQIKECHYCREKVDWEGKAYNLDRKDNSADYLKENCVVCCTRCNIGKGRFFTYEEWKEVGELIRSWKK